MPQEQNMDEPQGWLGAKGLGGIPLRKRVRVGLAFLGLLGLSGLGLPGCSETPVEPFTPDELGTDAPEEIINHTGFFVKMPGDDRRDFYRYDSERSVNQILRQMRHKPGGEIHFLPGTYEVEQRIFAVDVPNLKISGSDGVKFVFTDAPDVLARTTKPVKQATDEVFVSDPGKFKAGGRYQIYIAHGKGDRLLEFEVVDVLEDRVKTRHPIHFMPHVNWIGENSQVMEEINFFRVARCPNFLLQNIVMDGRNRGGVRGHTSFCGVYATGDYKEHERATTLGFTVRGCTFLNLKGRGVVFYGTAEAVVENNYFENIRAQAIEIDHFSSGLIRNNYVKGAEVGVMVNDAYESIVEHNILTHCEHGVRFLEIYDDPWVNTGNIIRENQIGPGCNAGVMFFNEGMHDNQIIDNHFEGMRQKHWVINGENNQIDLE